MIRRLPLPRLRSLARDSRAATLPEFAIIAPAFFLLLFGIFDIGQGVYIQSVLQGAVQDGGRDSGLESGKEQLDTIDQYVRDQVQPLVPNATFTITRKNYETFSDVGRPEDFTDANGNNAYDSDECFMDANGNEQWDADMGGSGLGGANDIVLYTVTVTYDRIFPLWRFLGQSERGTVTASTTLRNQPYGSQAARTAKQVCPAT